MDLIALDVNVSSIQDSLSYTELISDNIPFQSSFSTIKEERPPAREAIDRASALLAKSNNRTKRSFAKAADAWDAIISHLGDALSEP
jgi:hypothetical protein